MGRRRRATPGSYLLILELARDRALAIGRLGTFWFSPGWYLYAGSALGGLEQRVSRHLRPPSRRHWHLDYLRAEAPIREVWLFPGAHRVECELARTVLSLSGASIPAPGFGASDCRCAAHLVHFPGRPSPGDLGWPAAPALLLVEGEAGRTKPSGRPGRAAVEDAPPS